MGRKKVDVTRGDINSVNRAIKRGLDDGSPNTDSERKNYCAQVLGSFQSFLKVRLEYMIKLQQDELSNPMTAREQDLFTKGTINALSLLLDWGKDMENEYMSYDPKKEVNQPANNTTQDGPGVIISSVM